MLLSKRRKIIIIFLYFYYFRRITNNFTVSALYCVVFLSKMADFEADEDEEYLIFFVDYAKMLC